MRAAILCVSLAAGLSVGLAGCQSLEGYPQPLETREQALSTVAADIQPAAVNAYAALTDPTQRVARRDQIVRARLYAIDINYDDFVRGLTSEQKAFAVGSDLVAAGLTGAATLAKSAATKTRLTTYASVALGARGTIDKEVFYSKTLPAVVTQMDASRKTVLAKVSEGLAQSDADYPLLAALADLQDYYTAGTLNGALNQISKDAGVKSDAAQQRIANVTTFKYATDASHTSLLGYWRPNGVTDAGHLATLLACTPLPAGAPAGATATARDLGRIVDGGSADQRAALIACAKAKDPSFT